MKIIPSALLFLSSFVLGPTALAAPIKLGLPLYEYPADAAADWAAATNAGGDKVRFIVANVDSGPGTDFDPQWALALSNATASGIAVYGYVSSQFGARDGAAADADVSAWFQRYPQITGIFIDEVDEAASSLPYYKARYDYIKGLSKTNVVVINPGTVPDEGYMAVCDINTIFEGDYQSEWLGATFPAWVGRFPAQRFFAIVYNVPTQDQMQAVLDGAKNSNIGSVFITDAATPSAALPGYFSEECDAIVSRNSADAGSGSSSSSGGLIGGVGLPGINAGLACRLGFAQTSPTNAALDVVGTPGAQYSIEFSTNLLDWTPVAGLTSSGTNQMVFSATSSGSGFYRAKLQ